MEKVIVIKVPHYDLDRPSIVQDLLDAQLDGLYKQTSIRHWTIKHMDTTTLKNTNVTSIYTVTFVVQSVE